MAAFWVVVPCCLVDVYRRFSGSCCLRHQGDDSTDDEDSKGLRSVAEPPDNMALQPKRRPSSWYRPTFSVYAGCCLGYGHGLHFLCWYPATGSLFTPLFSAVEVSYCWTLKLKCHNAHSQVWLLIPCSNWLHDVSVFLCKTHMQCFQLLSESVWHAMFHAVASWNDFRAEVQFHDMSQVRNAGWTHCILHGNIISRGQDVPFFSSLSGSVPPCSGLRSRREPGWLHLANDAFYLISSAVFHCVWSTTEPRK
jgi:hypothetical protein